MIRSPLSMLKAAAAAMIGTALASKMNSAQLPLTGFTPGDERVNWREVNHGIRGGRPKRTNFPRSFDSQRQRARYARQQSVHDYQRGLVACAACHETVPKRDVCPNCGAGREAHPSGAGPTDLFGVRQQQRAWARRQTKDTAIEARRSERKARAAALRTRQREREGSDNRGGLHGGLAVIYREGHLGRLGRVRDQLTGKYERKFA